MHKLKQYIPLLLLGCSNNDYPLYCKYIYSDGNNVMTCNNSVIVKIELELPFKGFINLFVIDDVFKNISEDFKYEITEDRLIITDGRFRTELVIEDFEIPDFSKLFSQIGQSSFLNVTDELIDTFKAAIKFTDASKGDRGYIVISKESISATDDHRAFYNKDSFVTEECIGINNKILGILDNTCEIVSVGYNTVIRSNNMLFVFSIDKLDFYPVDRLKEIIDKYNSVHPLCKFSDLKNAVNKLNSLSFGESTFFVNIKDKGEHIEVSYESVVNGSASVTIPSIVNDKLENKDSVFVNGKFIKSINDLDYTVYLNPIFNGIIFENDKYTNILMGVLLLIQK